MQAFWRGRHAVDLQRATVRASWGAMYGPNGENADRCALYLLRQ